MLKNGIMVADFGTNFAFYSESTASKEINIDLLNNKNLSFT